MTRLGVATYHDGRDTRAHTVEIAAEAGDLVLSRPDGRPLARWSAADLRRLQRDRPDGALVLSPDGPRGARLVVDAARAGAVLDALPDLGRTRRRRAARRALLAVLAGAVLLGTVALGFERGVAWTARMLPAAVERELGTQASRIVIDSFAASEEPMCDNAAGAAALGSLARRLRAAAELERPLRVEVVRSELVNAMALPGGRVLLFEGLLRAAAGPAEVAGVLAHEIGHVRARHPAEGLVRALGLRAGLMLLFGGSGLEDVLGSAGATLLQLSYGRAAEREADAAALAILAAAGIDGNGLARFLRRLAETGPDAAGVPAWLSTHPPGGDRARRMAAAARSGGPGLSDESWQALRNICGPPAGSEAGLRSAGPAAG